MSWAPLILSLKMAGWTMVLSAVVGTALVLLLDWPRMPARHFIDAVVCAPLVLPPTALGLYLVIALGHGSAIGEAWEYVFGERLMFTFKAGVIAATVASLPLFIRTARIGFDAVDRDLVAAARTLGAGRIRVLFTVILPLAAPALIAGAILAFARALGDYGAVMMVAGGTYQTAAMYIMDEMAALRDHNAHMMALATTIVGVSVMYASNRLIQRFRPRRD